MLYLSGASQETLQKAAPGVWTFPNSMTKLFCLWCFKQNHRIYLFNSEQLRWGIGLRLHEQCSKLGERLASFFRHLLTSRQKSSDVISRSNHFRQPERKWLDGWIFSRSSLPSLVSPILLTITLTLALTRVNSQMQNIISNVTSLSLGSVFTESALPMA